MGHGRHHLLRTLKTNRGVSDEKHKEEIQRSENDILWHYVGENRKDNRKGIMTKLCPELLRDFQNFMQVLVQVFSLMQIAKVKDAQTLPVFTLRYVARAHRIRLPHQQIVKATKLGNCPAHKQSNPRTICHRSTLSSRSLAP